MRAAASTIAFALPLMLGACLGASQPIGGECEFDRDCASSEVCARDGMCAAPSSVRAVVTTWTIGGMQPTEAACASHATLFIRFIGSDFQDSFSYAPVPCALGQFTVDKLPDRYIEVELGVDNGVSSSQRISSQNSAAINLVF